jgi:hypothetical protein
MNHLRRRQEKSVVARCLRQKTGRDGLRVFVYAANGEASHRRRAFAAQPQECGNATVKERANAVSIQPGTLVHTHVSAILPIAFIRSSGASTHK